MSSDVCNSVRNDEASLWHKRLSHVNLRLVGKAILAEAILGIPSLSGEDDKVCGDCLAGKQIRVSHKKVSECSTKRVLELLGSYASGKPGREEVCLRLC